MQKSIKTGFYTYVVELRNNVEFVFYLDREQSDALFAEYLDPFEFGSYTVSHAFKSNEARCPEPVRLKSAIIDFIVKTAGMKKLGYFCFCWNEHIKMNLYLRASEAIKHRLPGYDYYFDAEEGHVAFVRLETS